MAEPRELWRLRVNGSFGGSLLNVVGGNLVLAFQDREHWTNLAGLSLEGVGRWERRWENLAYFFCSKERLFVDGDKARRIRPDTGEVLVERDLGMSVYAHWALDAGPIYRIAEQARYFGLDGDTLDVLWEFQDEREDFTFDEGRLCCYRPGEGISIHDLPSLMKHDTVPVAPVLADGAHGHLGDLFCHFGYSGGGRAGVDLMTGELVWHHEEPAAYGFTKFQGEWGYSPRDGVSAYDLRSGEMRWKRTFGDIPASPLALHKGRIYFATGDRFVHVLDAATGETIWNHQLKIKITGTVEPSPVVPIDDDLVVVGTRKEIICLEVS